MGRTIRIVSDEYVKEAPVVTGGVKEPYTHLDMVCGPDRFIDIAGKLQPSDAYDIVCAVLEKAAEVLDVDEAKIVRQLQRDYSKGWWK